MTSFDRIEPRITELMEELSVPRVPDYFDSLLETTAATRQLPSWASLERWLPMGTITRIAPARQVPWRPIAVAGLLLLLAVAAVALYAGSQRQAPLPAPFGPAANGTILISTPAGEIVSVDVSTGETRPVIVGDEHDESPRFRADGRGFTFDRVTSEPGVWFASADGSAPRRLVDETSSQYVLRGIEWSQAGDRVVAVGRDPAGDEVILLIDPAGGQPVTLRPDLLVHSAALRFGTDQLVVSEDFNGHRRYWLMDVDDPANPRQLGVSEFAINEPALSPDGNALVYATWDDGLGNGGNLHVLDIESGEDTLVTPTGNDTYLWQSPQFLPDGRAVLANRWSADGTFQLSVVPVDGSGSDRGIGPVRTQDGGGATAYVSPDGSTVLAVYHDDGTEDGEIWQVDVATGTGAVLPWPAPQSLAWQRAGQ